MPLSDCPSQKQLEDALFSEDDLSVNIVFDHLESCDKCAERADQILFKCNTLGRRIGDLFREELLDTDRPEAEPTVLYGQQKKTEETFSSNKATSRIVSKHRLLKTIGCGGMGEVYLGQHIELEAYRAIKIVSRKNQDAPEALARFRREYEIAAKLNHPNLVRTIDAGVEDDLVFLVMDFVRGMNLKELVESQGTLGISDACSVVLQASAGLNCLAKMGYVHRDVKPSNIMVEPTGNVVLLDFGLTRIADSTAEHTKFTKQFQIVGSPYFMAPELFEDSQLASEGSDIYALGCVAYYLLSGQIAHASHPHESSQFLEIGQRHKDGSYPDLKSVQPEIPEDLSDIVAKMMAINPGDRYQNFDQIHAEILPYCETNQLPNLIIDRPIDDLARLPDYLLKSHESIFANAETRRGISSKKRNRTLRLFGPFVLFALFLWGVFLTGKSDVIVDSQQVPAKILVNGTEQEFKPLSDGRVKVKVRNGRQSIQLKFANADDFKANKWIFRFGENRIRVNRNQLTTVTSNLNPDHKTETKTKPAFGGKQRLERRLPDVVPQERQFEMNRPLSTAAIVQRPEPIQGVLSWTIETRSPRGEIQTLRLNHNRRRLAVAGNDGTIRIYHVPSFELQNALIGHIAITSVRWVTRDSLVSCSEDGVVRLWRLNDDTTAEILRTWDNDHIPAMDADVSPGGESVAIATTKGNQLFHLSEAKKQKTIRAYSWACTWSNRRDDEMLAVASSHNIKLVDSKTGVEAVLVGSGSRFQTMDWQPHGDLLAASGYFTDPTFLFDTNTKTRRTKIKHDHFMQRDVRWSPDGRRLAIVGHLDAVIWDSATEQTSTVKLVPADWTSVDWLDDQTLILARRYVPEVVTVDTLTGTMTTVISAHDINHNRINWSPNGSLTIACEQGVFRISENDIVPYPVVDGTDPIRTNSMTRLAGDHNKILVARNDSLYLHSDVNSTPELVTISESAENMAIAGHPLEPWAVFLDSKNRLIKIDEQLDTHELMKVDRKGWHAQLKWSPDGSMLALISEGRLRIWDGQLGDKTPLIDLSKNVGTIVAWSNDSRLLAMNVIGGIRVLRINEQKIEEVALLGEQKHWRNDGIAFSPDDQFLLARIDTRLRIWNTKDWKVFREIDSNIGCSLGRSVDWSPDGTSLCNMTNDGVARFYTSNSLEPQGTCLLISDKAWGTFSNSGSWYATEPLKQDLIGVIETGHGQKVIGIDELPNQQASSTMDWMGAKALDIRSEAN